ncbi:hypothetical protein CXB51_016750 [Gossypium anomalum]|uniref:CCHC-type domain-containing protein n=1 Tax=Gossypium anomalum TaxID=47600 RepID=A0A8J5YMU7_9ROSI|nr:hypothetical protein CXB51_016750 [Gossypium anomalum]
MSVSISLPASVSGDDGDLHSIEDRTTKKVRFKGRVGETSEDMIDDPNLSVESSRDSASDGDIDAVKVSIVNGIPAISFSDRVKEILYKEMELTIIIKLLGRNIGTMDHLWTIPHGSTLDQGFQPYATVSQCGFGLDSATGSTGVFVSSVLIDGIAQRVEYEALPTVCFGCGKYGHAKYFCPEENVNRNPISQSEVVKDASVEAAGGNVGEARPEFGPWMLVEKKSRRNLRNGRGNEGANKGENKGENLRKEPLASRFSALMGEDENRDILDMAVGSLLSVGDHDFNAAGKGRLIDRIGVNSLGDLDSSAGPSNITTSPSKEKATGGSKGNDVLKGIGLRLTANPALKSSSEFGPSKAADAVENWADLGRISGGPTKESNLRITLGQSALDKRLMHDNYFTQILCKEIKSPKFFSNSNSIFNNADTTHHASSNIDMVVDDVNCGDCSNEVQGVSNDENFDNIVAHSNPTFEGLEGTPVIISKDVLEPEEHSAITFRDPSHKKGKGSSARSSRGNFGEGVLVSREKIGGKDLIGCNGRKASNALRGRGNRFKASGNSRVSLAKSMEEMAKFISSPNLKKNLNSGSEEGALGCASVKFHRIFQEYYREHSPDIISLLETRVSRSKAAKIIAKLGFPNSHRVEAIGFSGGIWIGWKNSVRLKIIFNHPQFIMAQVGTTFSSNSIFISFVYGIPNRQKRNDLWDALKSSIPLGNIPWVAIGGFNAILLPSEKLGGMSTGRRCPLFGDFVDKAELHDLGFRGPPFTWHRGLLFERLDRALGNEVWVQAFPNSLVTYLSKIKSDHRPLLLSLNPKVSLSKGQPFCFLAGWVEHPEFRKFVEDCNSPI